MCLIALAWRAHPRYPLVLAGNRDEFHERPAVALAEWKDGSGVVGGRDGLHGGSWLALRGARLAAVTNVRRPPFAQDGLSRGRLVSDFVRGDLDCHGALRELIASAPDYRPFNLIVHDGRDLAVATNTPDFAMRRLEPGVHGVSNGGFDAPWPKIERLTGRLAAWLDSPAAGVGSDEDEPDVEPLFAALADNETVADTHLPDTGVGLDLERFLSSPFIAGETYGTRASTVVLIGEGHAEITERRYGPNAQPLGRTRMRLVFDRAAEARRIVDPLRFGVQA